MMFQNRKKKNDDKTRKWSDKMKEYYSKTSNKKLEADLKAAGFKLKKK